MPTHERVIPYDSDSTFLPLITWKTLPAKRYTPAIALLLIFITQPSHAAVFKCEENGVVIYADKPCSDKSQQITIKQHKPAPRNVDRPTTTYTEKTRPLIQKLEASRYRRKITREITSLKRKIESREKMQERELMTLKEMIHSIDPEDDFDDELEADKQRQSISKEMRVVSDKYAKEIEILNEDLKSLQKELSNLNL